MRAGTLLSWVALWALGFVRASVRARTGGCGSVSSLTVLCVSYFMCSRVLHYGHGRVQDLI
jgi:hypothetical protein